MPPMLARPLPLMSPMLARPFWRPSGTYSMHVLCDLETLVAKLTQALEVAPWLMLRCSSLSSWLFVRSCAHGFAARGGCGCRLVPFGLLQ